MIRNVPGSTTRLRFPVEECEAVEGDVKADVPGLAGVEVNPLTSMVATAVPFGAILAGDTFTASYWNVV